MGERCPHCNNFAIGERAIRLNLRGTGTPIDGVLCGGCGVVYVTDDEQERIDERIAKRIEQDTAQSRLDTFESPR